MLVHLLGLIIALMIGSAAVALYSPKLQREIAMWLRENGYTKTYDDEVMMKALKVYQNLVKRIKGAYTEAELERWYERIAKFHDNYRGRISDSLMKGLENSLYEAYNNRKWDMRGYVRASNFHILNSVQ